MGDIGPCELIDGRIVRMNPTGRSHAYVAANLSMAFESVCPTPQVGRGVGWPDRQFHTISVRITYAADVVFVSKERLAQTTESGYLKTAPDLVVEIISPSDRWQDVRD